MADNRRAGIIQVSVDGARIDVLGNWTYNLGNPKRESIVGADEPHGYTEAPQVSFIEGEVTDSKELDLNALTTLDNVSVVLQLAVGPRGPAKAIALSKAYYAGEGTGNTKNGNIGVRFESKLRGEEVTP